MITVVTRKESVQVPGAEVELSPTEAADAWREGRRTVKLYAPIQAMRVHTGGARHIWFAIGDVVMTRDAYVTRYALPKKPVAGRDVHFTQQALYELPAGAILNVGVCARIFGHAGRGVQAEWIGGSRPILVREIDGFWSNARGTA